MLSLLLFIAYAIICVAQLLYILRSEPSEAEQHEQVDAALMANWWHGFPI